MTAQDITITVNNAKAGPVKVRAKWGEQLLVFDESGTALGPVENLLSPVLNGEHLREKVGREFHQREDKTSANRFVFGFELIGEDPARPELFLRWEDTGDLRQIVGVEVEGEFRGQQSRLDFEELLLDGHTFAVAQGQILGRDAIWVGSRRAEDKAVLSWRFTDAPPDPEPPLS